MPANTRGSFNLSQVIKDKLAASALADPQQIALALLDDGDIPKGVYREVLEVTLPQMVREHIRTLRRPQVRSGKDNFSQRWESGYRYWRVHTGTEWRFLDDCTSEEVYAVADEYRRRADQELQKAEEYEAVAALLEGTPGAKTVADLPETEVRELLRGVAA